MDVLILLAEDEPIVRFYLNTQIQTLGYNVISVKSYKHAVEKLQQQKFDILITDVNFAKEDYDGFDLIDVALALYPDIHIIVESAYADFEEKAVNYASNVYAFLRKPIDLNTFESALHQIHERIRWDGA